MKDAKKSKGPDGKRQTASLLIGIAAFVLAVAGVAYFSGLFGAAPAAPPPVPQQTPFAMESVQALLKSYDNGGNLVSYNMSYSDNGNGFAMHYELASDGNSSWVAIDDPYGARLSGYFGGSGDDSVCLAYDGSMRCALVGNSTDAKAIAATIRVILPNKSVYFSEKTQVASLIDSGAMKVSKTMPAEKVGVFDTNKITYTLDYSNLTVKQLSSIGLAPNDPSIYTTTQVSRWVDGATGLVVKTSTAIYTNGAKTGSYEGEYDRLLLSGAHIPPRQGAMVEAATFVSFYKEWISDLVGKEQCNALGSGERNPCFKTLAVSKRNWEICKLISEKLDFEACTLVVAQTTNNNVLCEKLDLLADDCYIGIVGQTGNYELCKKLKNTSLYGNCSDAAASGKRAIDAQQQALAKRIGMLGCGANSDCAAQGSHKQFCLPKNSSDVPAGSEDSLLFACLKGVPCSCQEGFCGFGKNDTYYNCISDVENDLLNAYLASLIPNQTANMTNYKNSSK